MKLKELQIAHICILLIFWGLGGSDLGWGLLRANFVSYCRFIIKPAIL